MWRIVKSEINYNKARLVAIYLVTAGLWIIHLFDPDGMFQLFAIPAFFLLMIFFLRVAKEKRARLYATLPVSIKHIGFTNGLLFSALFQILMLLVWPLQLLVDPASLANEFIPMPGTLTLGALTVGVVIGYTILKDCKASWYWLLLYWIAIFSMIFSKMLLRDDVEQFEMFFRNVFLESMAMAVIANLLCFGLLYLRSFTFAKRKSYLDPAIARCGF